MTHQQLIDYLESYLENIKEQIECAESLPQRVISTELEKLARVFYMQLCTMETNEPITFTSTTFTNKCEHNFDIGGMFGFRCLKCGIHPSEIVINSSST